MENSRAFAQSLRSTILELALTGSKRPGRTAMRARYCPVLAFLAFALLVSAGSSAQDCEPSFRRGDATADGDLNITDAVSTLNFLFLGGTALNCADAADADDNGAINITDAVYTLNFLFLGGTEIPEPAGPECGIDPTDDAVGCDDFAHCP